MQIDTFEQEVDSKIIARGRQYFSDGLVTDLFSEEGCFTAYVDGSELYEVEVTISETGNILELSCDCPYEWGDVCKHGVAALLAIRAHCQQQKTQPKSKKASQKKPNLQTLLMAQSKEVLVGELFALAERDRTLRQALLLRFGKRSDEIEGSRKLVRQCMQRRSFWEYGTVDDALEGAWTVLDRAERCAEDDPERAVRLCLVVMPEVVALTGYCDDSAGEISGILAPCMDILETAAQSAQNRLSAEQRAALFQVIFAECGNTAYDGWEEHRLDLLRLLLYFCKDMLLRNQLTAALLQEQQRPLRGYSAHYYREELAKLQLELFTRWGDPEQAAHFLAENLDLPDFRRRAIEAAMLREDYPSAAHLAEEGMTQNAEYAGLVHEWRAALYCACEAMGDRMRVLELAEYFVLHEREGYAYYATLKGGYPPEAWPKTLEQLLVQFEKRSHPGRVYVDILLEEGDFDRLLTYIQKNPSELPGLAGRFPAAYHNKLSEWYRQLILHRAKSANNRSGYREICGLLRRFGADMDKTVMLDLIRELKAAYPRRPAFQEELGKLM